MEYSCIQFSKYNYSPTVSIMLRVEKKVSLLARGYISVIIVDAISLGCSEGVQVEYVAIFLAVLFPGALVAFNRASLQALPVVASLRVYCAGIWHNAAVCVHMILFTNNVLYYHISLTIDA